MAHVLEFVLLVEVSESPKPGFLRNLKKVQFFQKSAVFMKKVQFWCHIRKCLRSWIFYFQVGDRPENDEAALRFSNNVMLDSYLPHITMPWYGSKTFFQKLIDF